jgi:hypothetical protein
MTTWDMILVYERSRVHNHYLNICRYLSRRLRIGIYVVPTTKAEKTMATERLFLELCREAGATILESGPHVCGLLALPALRYDVSVLEELATSVSASRRVALQVFGHGIENLGTLEPLGIKRLYVYDKRVFANKLKSDADRRWVTERFELIEMGSPFAKYPAFPDFSTDYMIAFPTDLSFLNTRGKVHFLDNVHRLLDTFPAPGTVVNKLHNVSDGGRLPERQLRGFTLGLRLGELGLSMPSPPLSGRAGEAIARMAFGARYARLLGRTTPLEARTPYYNLGLELFLPGVRRGLITGRSSVVWYALLHRIPVFNCDDETERARGEGVTDSYRAFGVPPCGGRPRFDPVAFDRIDDSVRQADLLELLQKEL